MDAFVSKAENPLLSLLSSWYQLTLENPEYFFAILFLASILMGWIISWFYRNRWLVQKRHFEAENFAVEQERLKISHHLEGIKFQLHNAQEQLQEKDEYLQQITKDHQSAQAASARSVSELESRIGQRTSDMAQFVRMLESECGLDSAVVDHSDADTLWQRQVEVAKHLTERLQHSQTATAALEQNQHQLAGKLSEKHSIIEELQTALEAQDSQIAQLSREIQSQRESSQQEIEKLRVELENKERAINDMTLAAARRGSAQAEFMGLNAPVAVLSATEWDEDEALDLAVASHEVDAGDSVLSSPVVIAVDETLASESVVHKLEADSEAADANADSVNATTEIVTEPEIPTPISAVAEPLTLSEPAIATAVTVAQATQTPEPAVDTSSAVSAQAPKVEATSVVIDPIPESETSALTIADVETVSIAEVNSLTHTDAEDKNAAQADVSGNKKSWFTAIKTSLTSLTDKAEERVEETVGTQAAGNAAGDTNKDEQVSDKKSWFSPIAAQLKNLTSGSEKTGAIAEEELNQTVDTTSETVGDTATSITAIDSSTESVAQSSPSDSMSTENVGAVAASVEVIDSLKESISATEVDGALPETAINTEGYPITEKKSWFSPIATQLTGLLGGGKKASKKSAQEVADASQVKAVTAKSSDTGVADTVSVVDSEITPTDEPDRRGDINEAAIVDTTQAVDVPVDTPVVNNEGAQNKETAVLISEIDVASTIESPLATVAEDKAVDESLPVGKKSWLNGITKQLKGLAGGGKQKPETPILATVEQSNGTAEGVKPVALEEQSLSASSVETIEAVVDGVADETVTKQEVVAAESDGVSLHLAEDESVDASVSSDPSDAPETVVSNVENSVENPRAVKATSWLSPIKKLIGLREREATDSVDRDVQALNGIVAATETDSEQVKAEDLIESPKIADTTASVSVGSVPETLPTATVSDSALTDVSENATSVQAFNAEFDEPQEQDVVLAEEVVNTESLEDNAVDALEPVASDDGLESRAESEFVQELAQTDVTSGGIYMDYVRTIADIAVSSDVKAPSGGTNTAENSNSTVSDSDLVDVLENAASVQSLNAELDESQEQDIVFAEEVVNTESLEDNAVDALEPVASDDGLESRAESESVQKLAQTDATSGGIYMDYVRTIADIAVSSDVKTSNSGTDTAEVSSSTVSDSALMDALENAASVQSLNAELDESQEQDIVFAEEVVNTESLEDNAVDALEPVASDDGLESRAESESVQKLAQTDVTSGIYMDYVRTIADIAVSSDVKASSSRTDAAEVSSSTVSDSGLDASENATSVQSLNVELDEPQGQDVVLVEEVVNTESLEDSAVDALEPVASDDGLESRAESEAVQELAQTDVTSSGIYMDYVRTIADIAVSSDVKALSGGTNTAEDSSSTVSDSALVDALENVYVVLVMDNVASDQLSEDMLAASDNDLEQVTSDDIATTAIAIEQLPDSSSTSSSIYMDYVRTIDDIAITPSEATVATHEDLDVSGAEGGAAAFLETVVTTVVIDIADSSVLADVDILPLVGEDIEALETSATEASSSSIYMDYVRTQEDIAVSSNAPIHAEKSDVGAVSSTELDISETIDARQGDVVTNDDSANSQFAEYSAVTDGNTPEQVNVDQVTVASEPIYMDYVRSLADIAVSVNAKAIDDLPASERDVVQEPASSVLDSANALPLAEAESIQPTDKIAESIYMDYVRTADDIAVSTSVDKITHSLSAEAGVSEVARAEIINKPEFGEATIQVPSSAVIQETAPIYMDYVRTLDDIVVSPSAANATHSQATAEATPSDAVQYTENIAEEESHPVIGRRLWFSQLLGLKDDTASESVSELISDTAETVASIVVQRSDAETIYMDYVRSLDDIAVSPKETRQSAANSIASDVAQSEDGVDSQVDNNRAKDTSVFSLLTPLKTLLGLEERAYSEPIYMDHERSLEEVAGLVEASDTPHAELDDTTAETTVSWLGSLKGWAGLGKHARSDAR